VTQTAIIVGLGEVGKPLFEIIKTRHEVLGVGIELAAPLKRCDVMHICFPFRDGKFMSQVVEYIGRYQPALTIINSTVGPGTSRRIAGASVVNHTATKAGPISISLTGCCNTSPTGKSCTWFATRVIEKEVDQNNRSLRRRRTT
jgi:hypothetical protein